MIKSVISRTYQRDETIGSLYIFDGEKLLYRCKSLELPDLGNQVNHSCIPEGYYTIVKAIRPDGMRAFNVLNVPGRTEIQIHIFNFAAGGKIETKGCIGPGTFFIDINEDGTLDIGGVGTAFDKLWLILPDKSGLYIISNK